MQRCITNEFKIAQSIPEAVEWMNEVMNQQQ